MVIGAVVGVFALKAHSGELWEKVPELHTVLQAGRHSGWFFGCWNCKDLYFSKR